MDALHQPGSSLSMHPSERTDALKSAVPVMLLVQSLVSHLDPLWAGCSSPSPSAGIPHLRAHLGRASSAQVCSGTRVNICSTPVPAECRPTAASWRPQKHRQGAGMSQAVVFPQTVPIWGREGGFGSAAASAGRGPFKNGSAGGRRPPAFTPGVGKGGRARARD